MSLSVLNMKLIRCMNLVGASRDGSLRLTCVAAMQELKTCSSPSPDLGAAIYAISIVKVLLLSNSFAWHTRWL